MARLITFKVRNIYDDAIISSLTTTTLLFYEIRSFYSAHLSLDANYARSMRTFAWNAYSSMADSPTSGYNEIPRLILSESNHCHISALLNARVIYMANSRLEGHPFYVCIMLCLHELQNMRSVRLNFYRSFLESTDLFILLKNEA